jgi:D-serine deaminase-like pyridoxal phosphate-dependent protein
VVDAGKTWFVSDEHTTFGTVADHPIEVGDRVKLLPAHVDPTVSQHPCMYVVNGELTPDTQVTAVWPVDLRGW